MKMSVFRQGDPPAVMDHLACVENAVDDDAVQMIMASIINNLTVLVGQRNGEAIIKPWIEGDQKLSFEGLYDQCISLMEFRRMRELKVKSTADFPPHLYEVRVALDPQVLPQITMRLKAHNDMDANRKFKRLAGTNADVQKALSLGWLEFMLTGTGAAVIRPLGVLRTIENAPDDAPEWEVLPLEKD